MFSDCFVLHRQDTPKLWSTTLYRRDEKAYQRRREEGKRDKNEEDSGSLQVTFLCPQLSNMEGIAVVGYSFKLPGDVQDEASFWDMLASRKNMMTEWPSDRATIDSFTSGSTTSGNKVCFGASNNHGSLRRMFEISP